MGRADRFSCSRCGACCRLIGLAHPEFDRGDLGCVFLRDGNKCLVYKRRPYFCNVHELWKRKYSGKCSWDEFKAANAESCEAARKIVRSMKAV